MTTMNDLLGQQLGPIHKTIEKLPEQFRVQAQTAEYERMRTLKFIRLPVISGTVASNAVQFGGDNGEQIVAPAEGYVWSIRELNVTGLTAGGTPDVVNIYRNQVNPGKIFWQLNGNVFLQTFGRGEKILYPGDSLLVVNLGSLTAASGSQITLSGTAMEVATERIGRFF